MAAQCFLICGGVKWKKLGIFISSVFAYLTGGRPLFSDGFFMKPCRIGSGIAFALKPLAVGQTLVQSWSTDIFWYLAKRSTSVLIGFKTNSIHKRIKNVKKKSENSQQIERFFGYHLFFCSCKDQTLEIHRQFLDSWKIFFRVFFLFAK